MLRSSLEASFWARPLRRGPSPKLLVRAVPRRGWSRSGGCWSRGVEAAGGRGCWGDSRGGPGPAGVVCWADGQAAEDLVPGVLVDLLCGAGVGDGYLGATLGEDPDKGPAYHLGVLDGCSEVGGYTGEGAVAVVHHPGLASSLLVALQLLLQTFVPGSAEMPVVPAREQQAGGTSYVHLDRAQGVG